MDLTAERPPAPEHSLAALISDERVPWTTLERRYGPLLGLVELLIGVVPNCDRYLEIWEPAFRTYNVLVPNFLNLPASVLGVGGAPVSRSQARMARVAAMPSRTGISMSMRIRSTTSL